MDIRRKSFILSALAGRNQTKCSLLIRDIGVQVTCDHIPDKLCPLYALMRQMTEFTLLCIHPTLQKETVRDE